MRISIYLWIFWYAYWIISARRRIRATEANPVKRESRAGRLGYLGLMVIGFGLLFWRREAFSLGHLWPEGKIETAVGLAVQILGLGLAIWARQVLGGNWAGRVTIGGNQELVMRGPYRLVRHPIYSGLLLGLVGTAIIEGLGRGFVGVLLVLLGVAFKLRREEAALREHFGSAYQEYARRVPALLPVHLGTRQ